MAVHRFDVADIAPTPWKNGGGSTREIACWPPGTGIEAFDWRVSIAAIAASGPFSRFGGVDRVITLLDGDGVHLRGEGVDHRLAAPLAPFAFSGDVAIDCTLLGGASSDFNVMTRRGRMRAEVRVLRSSSAWPDAPQGLLLAVRGPWRVGAERLSVGQGLWWADPPVGGPLDSDTADAALLAVRWTRES